MKWSILIGLNLAHFVGLIFFCLGFFPSKIVLQGFNTFNNEGGTGRFEPVFDKIVVMVVDALRADFVFSDHSGMKFSQSLINQGSAMGFTAFSNPPTVTLPRLKGITTGSTPNFLDAVLNVIEEDASNNLAKQDSWVQQLKIHDKRIHMFGDDTWLKLFPKMFDKVDGTASFFVSDFTEVDNNVTRHLDYELDQQDWDCLILHYLGLDHIGHKGGPNSVFMEPKQAEMDGIIKKIYEKLDENTLFIVLGDHGMNEIGNHGGSSKGETSAALLFISDKLKALTKHEVSPLPQNEDYEYYSKVQQIDLVPTIVSLLRLPIPMNSLGIFIKELLPLWPTEQQINVINDNFNHFKNFEPHIIVKDDVNDIYEQLRDLQSNLIQNATNYDVSKIMGGIAINLLCIVVSIVLTVSNIHDYRLVLINVSIPLSLGISSFGSSLVEEEHQIWWWLIMVIASVALVWLKDLRVFYVLFYMRVLRNWNNMGQKFINESSFGAILTAKPLLKWCLILLTVLHISFRLRSNSGPVVKLLNFSSVAFIICFKVLFAEIDGQDLPWNYRISDSLADDKSFITSLSATYFYVIGVSIVTRLVFARIPRLRANVIRDLNDIVLLMLVYQCSLNNIPMFLVLSLMRDHLVQLFGKHMSKDPIVNIALVQALIVVLSNAVFFNFGQTNSLATIDLSNSYNGVSEYSMVPIGVLTFLNNFGGVLFLVLLSFQLNFNSFKLSRTELSKQLKVKFLLNLQYYLIVSVFYLVTCYLQRNHLFIWTVFSPKILFLLAWNLFLNFVEALITGVILMIGFYQS